MLEKIFSAEASDNLQVIGCNDADVKRLLPLLPLNKSPGRENISAEFIRFAHPSICMYLSKSVQRGGWGFKTPLQWSVV